MLSLRRGSDLFMCYDAALCRELLGLPAAPGRHVEATTGVDKGRGKGSHFPASAIGHFDIPTTDDVSMGAVGKKKRKRPIRKRKKKGGDNGAFHDVIDDAFADSLAVPAGATALPGGGYIFRDSPSEPLKIRQPCGCNARGGPCRDRHASPPGICSPGIWPPDWRRDKNQTFAPRNFLVNIYHFYNCFTPNIK